MLSTLNVWLFGFSLSHFFFSCLKLWSCVVSVTTPRPPRFLVYPPVCGFSWCGSSSDRVVCEWMSCTEACWECEKVRENYVKRMRASSSPGTDKQQKPRAACMRSVVLFFVFIYEGVLILHPDPQCLCCLSWRLARCVWRPQTWTSITCVCDTRRLTHSKKKITMEPGVNINIAISFVQNHQETSAFWVFTCNVDNDRIVLYSRVRPVDHHEGFYAL